MQEAPVIVEGVFALVSSGNVTESWMLDGDDIQERADAAMDRYYGSASVVLRRGIAGYGIDTGGRYLDEVYTSRTAAQAYVDRHRLSRAGRALFGERWQSDLARALSVGDRRVREWVAGDRSIPAGVWADLIALLRERAGVSAALLAELDNE